MWIPPTGSTHGWVKVWTARNYGHFLSRPQVATSARLKLKYCGVLDYSCLQGFNVIPFCSVSKCKLFAEDRTSLIYYLMLLYFDTTYLLVQSYSDYLLYVTKCGWSIVMRVNIFFQYFWWTVYKKRQVKLTLPNRILNFGEYFHSTQVDLGMYVCSVIWNRWRYWSGHSSIKVSDEYLGIWHQ